ncbi:MAG: hypothetical protein M1821_004219 [Bathelium mastoideum]|nr:MAG: hypothetical protein M1821_004219 [Bathelium mastoideum]
MAAALFTATRIKPGVDPKRTMQEEWQCGSKFCTTLYIAPPNSRCDAQCFKVQEMATKENMKRDLMILRLHTYKTGDGILKKYLGPQGNRRRSGSRYHANSQQVQHRLSQSVSSHEYRLIPALPHPAKDPTGHPKELFYAPVPVELLDTQSWEYSVPSERRAGVKPFQKNQLDLALAFTQRGARYFYPWILWFDVKKNTWWVKFTEKNGASGAVGFTAERD